MESLLYDVSNQMISRGFLNSIDYWILVYMQMIILYVWSCLSEGHDFVINQVMKFLLQHKATIQRMPRCSFMEFKTSVRVIPMWVWFWNWMKRPGNHQTFLNQQRIQLSVRNGNMFKYSPIPPIVFLIGRRIMMLQRRGLSC